MVSPKIKMRVAINTWIVNAHLKVFFNFSGLPSPMAKDKKRWVPVTNVSFINENIAKTDPATLIMPKSDIPSALKTTLLV